MNAQPLVELANASKIFRTRDVETRALDGVTLTIPEGDFVAIAGPSGCGKTTLLSVLGLLDTLSEGEYRLAGTDVARLDVAQRALVRNRQIGFVFQAFNLIGERTVADNVALPLKYRGIAPGERAVMVAEALDRVGMSHRANHYPSELSGGQQQRVAVARAIAGKPPLLLADEPTGNLDSTNGEAVMDLLGTLHREGATICMVTHDPRYAGQAARTIHLFDGQVADARGADVARELVESGFHLR